MTYILCDGEVTLHDAHVWAYRWVLPQIKQHKTCDKVWKAYEQGKMTLEQAIEASYRADEKMCQEYRRIGYIVE